MTRAQADALEIGGLDQHCLDAHEDRVCLHCGACRECASGCECDTPEVACVVGTYGACDGCAEARVAIDRA